MTPTTGLTRAGFISAGVFAACVLLLVALAAAPRGSEPAARGRSERLDTPREIQGLPCKTRAFFDATGRLTSCTLSRQTTFANGLQLPAGTHVGVDAQQRPDTAFLPANTVLDGHLCVGTGTHDPMTNFHPNGRLRFCNLAEPETIQGIPCQKSSFWIWVTQGGAGTYFHDNGALHRCLLAADVTVEGRTFRKKQHITLDPDGRLDPAAGRSAREPSSH